MALSPRIELRQSQSLVMTPQLQQAIKLLQMDNLTLAEFVAREVDRNPLLEMAPSPAPSAPTPRIAGTGGSNLAEARDAVAAPVSLADHLHAQLRAARADAATVAAARALAEELEDDGYLRTPLAEVAARYGIPDAVAARGLSLLQSCDPVGVGARNLQECLALQLRERDRLDPAMQALLANLPMAVRERSAELMAICGVDAADLADMLTELRALDPKPGLRFSGEPVQVVAPDIYIARARDDGWTVELNTETLPRVLVNNSYLATLAGSQASAETRQYVSEMRASASWLARSLEQRARTMLRVAAEMAQRQAGFLASGPAALQPLTQRAVAERLNLHESTISRVTAGKYFSCDQGVFELRFLFSAAIPASDGGQAFSAVAVQDRIRRMIAEERRGRVLSDDKIMTALADEGIDIARRTVAKYREGMGIPSSMERRRHQTASTL